MTIQLQRKCLFVYAYVTFPVDAAGRFKPSNHRDRNANHSHSDTPTFDKRPIGRGNGRGLADNSGGFKLNMSAGKDVDENTQNRR